MFECRICKKVCSFEDVVSLTSGKVLSSCSKCRKRNANKESVTFLEPVNGFDELSDMLEGWRAGTVVGYVCEEWEDINIQTFADGMKELAENLGIGRFLTDKSVATHTYLRCSQDQVLANPESSNPW